MVLYRDRTDAGQKLAQKLKDGESWTLLLPVQESIQPEPEMSWQLSRRCA